MRGLILGFILFGLIFGCLQLEAGNGTGQTANPAAVECLDRGYEYEVRTGELGGEYGVCKYAGEECGAWELYRGECCLKDEECSCDEGTPDCVDNECTCIVEEAELPNPASVYCEDKGYTLEMRTDEAGQYGVCIYNGEECEEWAYYRGECCLTDEDCECEEGTPVCEDSECTCEIEEPEELLPPHTNKTVEEFLDEGLARVNSAFFRDYPSGEFVVRTYTWIIGGSDIKPDQVPIGSADLVRAVLFNDEKDNSLKGFAFKIYEPKEGGLAEARGIGVFNSRTTKLDLYYDNPELDLEIVFYPFGKNLYDCEVTDKEQYLAEDDSWITNYMFMCEDSGP